MPKAKADTPKSMDSRSQKIKVDSEADLNEIQQIRDKWDDLEAIMISDVTDSISVNTRSRVTGSQLTTIALEGAGRVMGQLATGQVKAMSKDEKGSALLLDLILQRYVIPNDNEPWSHLIKQRMKNFYSRVYGVFPEIYDYEVRPGYVGPASDLVPIRNWIPQRGRVTPAVSDYTHIDNWVSYQWIENKIKSEKKKKTSDWNIKAMEKVLKELDNDSPNSRATSNQDQRQTSYVQRERDNQQSEGSGKSAKIRLRTRYESGEDGHWVTVAPDYEFAVFRDIKNPHGSNRIPVVLKQTTPLIDSTYGLGDFERGKSIQFAMDSITNLTLDGAKMKIYPPMIVNPNGVVPSSLTYAPGKRWLETTPNSIRSYETGPSGLNHFQAIHGFLAGLLLNQNGTTDTAVNAESALDPGFGKTPEALKLLSARENTRDNMDRFFQEESIEELYNGFICLITKNQEKPIDLHLFDAEIEMLADLGYEDIAKQLKKNGSKDGRYSKVTLDKSYFKDKEYKFYVDAGSTTRKDDADQAEALSALLVMASKIPNLDEMMQVSGKKFDIAELVTQVISKSGVENPERIVYSLSEDDQNALQQQQAEKKAQEQAAMQAQQPQMPGMPPQPQIPNDPYMQAALNGGTPVQNMQGDRGMMQPQPDIPMAGVQPSPQVNSTIDTLLNR